MAVEQGRWYVLRGTLPAGAPTGAMRLEVVLADGEAASVPAGIGGGGARIGLVTGFARPVATWRVLAGEDGEAHPVGEVRLDAVGRFGALLRMLPGRRRGVFALVSGTAGGVMLMVRRLLGGGPHEAMRAVASRYQRAVAVEGVRVSVASASWTPTNHLAEARDARGRTFLQTAGDDPQLLLCANGAPTGLPRGWYELVLDLDVASGVIESPVLYPDYGAGMGESHAIPLPEADARGRIQAFVHLEKPAIALRLDPSVKPVRFRIESHALHRRTGMGALWRKSGGRSGAAVPAEAVDGSPTWFPTHQLTMVCDALGTSWLEASGDDPQLMLHQDGQPVELPGGWYELTLRVAIDAGSLIAPALYPDYGKGLAEDNAIRLPEPDEQGRIHLLVMLKSTVFALRFDPSVRPLTFRIRDSQLRRRGRIGALWFMLDRLRRSDGSHDWRAIFAVLGAFVRDTFRLGLSAAAARLHAGADDVVEKGGDYAQWVRRYDTLLPTDIRLMASRAAAFDDAPLVSILVPVYQTPLEWLRRCLDSVLAQAYQNWEICIVDDASPSPAVGRLLARYARRDARIRVMRRDTNGHISAASNDALAMARGEYVALLDHDDELRPHALLEMMELFERNPRLQLAYSDEDKIDERGRRFQPNFKPDWNPDLLLSQNYVCHFTVVRTELARQAGGFRQGYEGSQDHDLILRCSERLEHDQIGHVPRVLYHWRAIGGSTALERSAKDYASAAGVRAVGDYLSRLAPGATAEELAHGHYRVRWPLPAPAPRVSIVIPTRDRLELLRTCVQSVLELTTYPDYEILVVDNRSEEPETLAWLEQVQADPRVRVSRHDAPFNYSAINNAAVTQASGDVVCLLNNDIEVVTPGWLEELVSHAMRPGIGAVGAMLHYPDNTIQHAGVILGLGGVANHIYTGLPAGTPGHGARALVAQNISAVTGACLVVRKSVYQDVGGLEERLQVAFNDIDFCLRLREAGYRNVWTPFAVLVHHESASRGRDESGERRERFLGEVTYMEHRWRGWLEADPAYNPNLALDDLASGLAFPPRTLHKRHGDDPVR